MDIVTLGEFFIDFFGVDTGKDFGDVSAYRPIPGGAPANVAVACSKLGKTSAFIGKVGDDPFGHYLEGVLRAQGVITRGLRFDVSARTSLAFVVKKDEHSADFLFYRNPGADMLLSVEDLDTEVLSSTSIFHFGSISLIHESYREATWEAIRQARRGGAHISFDVNYRSVLWPDAHTALSAIRSLVPEVDILKVNHEELKLLTGTDDVWRGGPILLGDNTQLLVVTMGHKGSYFLTPKDEGFVPAFTVKTVDSTGSGDAFMAGVLSALSDIECPPHAVNRQTLARLLRFANACGALTACKWGVIPALPSKKEVIAFLKQR